MDFHSLQSTLTEARALASSSRTVSFDNHYELLEELGKGAYGTVWKCCRRHDSMRRPYGVKIINKREAGAKGLRSVMGEVETMSLLSHPNIVRLEETFHDDQTLWIVMEYMAGGELQRALKRDGSFSEVQTRRITMQLLLALEFIHQKGIVHRDLKPENCLLSEGDLVCKISDFGFAVLVGVDQCLMSFCGTTVFMAPEIFNDTNYGKPVDMWALGVMVYFMFTGEYPFLGRNQKETTEAILTASYNMKEGKISEGSAELHDFISKLLVVDPNRRYSAREALKHPWIKLGMNMEAHDDEPKEPNPSGLRPRSVFRALSIAIMAAHRLLYLRYCRMLDTSDCGNCVMLRNFAYVVSGRYEPPNPSLECSGMFQRNPRGLSLLLSMVEVSRTLQSLDLSNNNIFNLTFLQQLVKVVSNHPSLVSLNLSNNPIPALAGRGLLRLARSPQSRLVFLGLEGTHLSAEAIAQITVALKERAASAPASYPPTQSCTGPRPLDQFTPTQSRSARTQRSRSQHGSATTSLVNLSRSPQSKGPRLPPIITSRRRNEK